MLNRYDRRNGIGYFSWCHGHLDERELADLKHFYNLILKFKLSRRQALILQRFYFRARSVKDAAGIFAAIPRNVERKNRSRMGLSGITAPVKAFGASSLVQRQV